MLQLTEQRDQKNQDIAFWGMRVAILMLIVSVLFVGRQAINCVVFAFSNNEQADVLAAIKRQSLLEETAAMPITDPLDKLDTAVKLRHFFSEQSITPWSELRSLDAVVGDKARVVKYTWQNGDKSSKPILIIEVQLTPTVKGNSDEPENSVTQLLSIVHNISEALPDYTVTVTRYPHVVISKESSGQSADGRRDVVPSMNIATIVIKKTKL
jgi:hypothetical protein